MATFSLTSLSASTNGEPIQITAVGTAGNPIHTAQASAVGWDQIFFWATNTDTVSRLLTVGWGVAGTSAGHLVEQYSLPAHSAPIPIATGQILNNALVVSAFADLTAKVNITGHVLRITP